MKGGQFGSQLWKWVVVSDFGSFGFPANFPMRSRRGSPEKCVDGDAEKEKGKKVMYKKKIEGKIKRL